jgi:hypothetical protein
LVLIFFGLEKKAIRNDIGSELFFWLDEDGVGYFFLVFFPVVFECFLDDVGDAFA